MNTYTRFHNPARTYHIMTSNHDVSPTFLVKFKLQSLNNNKHIVDKRCLNSTPF